MTNPENDEKDEFDLRNFLPFLLNQAAEESSLEFQQVYNHLTAYSRLSFFSVSSVSSVPLC